MGILDRRVANIIGKLTERIENRNFLSKIKRNVIDAFFFFSSMKRHRYNRSRGTWSIDWPKLVKIFKHAPLTRLYRFFAIFENFKENENYVRIYFEKVCDVPLQLF